MRVVLLAVLAAARGQLQGAPVATRRAVLGGAVTSVAALHPDRTVARSEREGPVRVAPEDLREALSRPCEGEGCKTVFLVRHAESEENANVRVLREAVQHRNLVRAGGALGQLVAGGLDAPLSPAGRAQVQSAGAWVRKTGFESIVEPDAVVVSPYRRARETCAGLFSVEPEVQPDLFEAQPGELLNGNFQRRIRRFEDWLAARPEKRLVVVGHSVFFKDMLGLDYRFENTGIYRVDFVPGAEPRWRRVTRVGPADAPAVPRGP